MNFDLSKLGKTASVLFLALAMAGCGGGGSETAEVVPEPEPMEPEPMEPTEAEMAIAAAQLAAAAAATAAETAAASAETAAMAAETASMNRAVIQTGEANSATASAAARTHADAAAVAAADAMAQSAAAAAATDATVAVAAKVAAEAAQVLAEAAVPMAESYRARAEMDAMSELMIDGKTKTVGESTLTIDERATTETPASPGTPSTTGFQGKIAYVTARTPPSINADGTDAKTGVEPRAINIGLEYDSSDDMARVHLITSYSKTRHEIIPFKGFDDAYDKSEKATEIKIAPADLQGYALASGTLTVSLKPVSDAYIRVHADGGIPGDIWLRDSQRFHGPGKDGIDACLLIQVHG